MFFSCSFFFYCSGDHRDLHSFPTRRSSDLAQCVRPLRLHPGCLLHAVIDVDVRAAVRRLEADSIDALVRPTSARSEEHTSELQSPYDLVCRLLLEKKKEKPNISTDIDIHES